MSPAERPRRPLPSPRLLMVLPPLFWAGNAVVGRAIVGEVPPLAFSFWRWALALALLLPFGWRYLAAERHALRRHWRVVTALAVTSVAAYNTLLYIALQTTTAINATLVASSLPVCIIALSWAWLGERVGARQALGVAVSLAGVLMVIAQGDIGVLLALEPRRGDLVVLAAVACWAVYSVLLRRHPVPLHPIALLTAQVAIGTVCILPFYLWELAVVGPFSPSPAGAAAILYVAIFPSLLAYLLWNQGVAALGANAAGQYSYLVPVFTAVLAVLLLGETFRWFHAAGLVLIFAGIWWATGRRRGG